MSGETGNVDTIFFTKYVEFCEELKVVYPEATAVIDLAKALPDEEKKSRFVKYIVPKIMAPKRNPRHNPTVLLPGVLISDEKWYSFKTIGDNWLSLSKDGTWTNINIASDIRFYTTEEGLKKDSSITEILKRVRNIVGNLQEIYKL